MKLHERIKFLREENGLTQKELSERIGISVISVQNWENGKKKPALNTIVSLCEAFQVSADYLLGINSEHLSKDERRLLSDYRAMDDFGRRTVDAVCEIEVSRAEQTEQPQIVSLRYIPCYISPSAAGIAAPIEGSDYDMIPVGKDVPKEAVYAVYISGNSMEPYIHDGELVYVDGSEILENGDVGIFAVDGAMYCKQIYIDRELTLHLLSANPARADASLHFPDDSGASVVCKGKVLGHRVPLDNIEDRM